MKRKLHQQFIDARTTMTYTEWLEARVTTLESGKTPVEPKETMEDAFVRLATELLELQLPIPAGLATDLGLVTVRPAHLHIMTDEDRNKMN